MIKEIFPLSFCFEKIEIVKKIVILQSKMVRKKLNPRKEKYHFRQNLQDRLLK